MNRDAKRNRHKRFWREVTFTNTESTPPLYRLLLDNRPITLPAGKNLEVPSRALAQALKEEWARIGPGASFSPDDLVLTRMAGSLIERIPQHRAEIIQTLHAYGVDDALCYQSAAQDNDLRQRVLDWASEQGLNPQVTEGVMPVKQDEAYRQRLSVLLEEAGEEILAALGVLVPLTGSFLLSWAFLHQIVQKEEAFRLAFADEQHQLMVWGQDEALAQRLVRAREEMEDALYFYELLQEKTTSVEKRI